MILSVVSRWHRAFFRMRGGMVLPPTKTRFREISKMLSHWHTAYDSHAMVDGIITDEDSVW